MSTTYILHGGETKKDNSDNKNFFKSFTSTVNKAHVTILLCYFAREKSEWKELFEQDKEAILGQTTKEVRFNMAEDPENLLNMMPTYDVLYVAGGQAELIEPQLSELKTLREKLEGKVYIGSSMGAFIVSKQYVLSFDEQDSKNVHKGLGWIPLSTLCHWDVENHKEMKINLLKEIDSEVPILILDECKYTVFVQ